MWAIAYGVIWIGKFVTSRKVEVGIGLAIVIAVAIVVKLVIWNNELYKSKKVEVVNKEDV